MKKVYAGVSNKQGDTHLFKFTNCIIESLSKRKAVSANVTCSLSKGVVQITKSKAGLTLQHSPMCPFLLVDKEKLKNKQDHHIPVAVSVIIESKDRHILLTRRPAHMRSSPNSWVPPGGHLEQGETLIECGQREVWEETGLDISKSDIKILCLWENVYPVVLGLGTPITHTLVVYCHTKLDETHSQLLTKIKADPSEVGAYTWLSHESVRGLFRLEQMAPVTQHVVQPDGRVVPKEMDYKSMFNLTMWASGCIFAGVQYALFTWNSMNNDINSRL